MPEIERQSPLIRDTVDLPEVPLLDILYDSTLVHELVRNEHPGSISKEKEAFYSEYQEADYRLLSYFYYQSSYRGSEAVMNHLVTDPRNYILIYPDESVINRVIPVRVENGKISMSEESLNDSNDVAGYYVNSGHFLISQEFAERTQRDKSKWLLEKNGFARAGLDNLKPVEYARREAAKYFLINPPVFNDMRYLNSWQYMRTVRDFQYKNRLVLDSYPDYTYFDGSSPYREAVLAIGKVVRRLFYENSEQLPQDLKLPGRKYVVYENRKTGLLEVGWIDARMHTTVARRITRRQIPLYDLLEQLTWLKKGGNEFIKLGKVGYVQTKCIPEVSALPDFAARFISGAHVFRRKELDLDTLLEAFSPAFRRRLEKAAAS